MSKDKKNTTKVTKKRNEHIFLTKVLYDCGLKKSINKTAMLDKAIIKNDARDWDKDMQKRPTKDEKSQRLRLMSLP